MPTETEEATTRAKLQYTEAIVPGLDITIDLKGILASEESEFQKVEILETYFGKVSYHATVLCSWQSWSNRGIRLRWWF